MSVVTNLTAQSAELFLSSCKSFPAQLQSINRKNVPLDLHFFEALSLWKGYSAVPSCRFPSHTSNFFKQRRRIHDSPSKLSHTEQSNPFGSPPHAQSLGPSQVLFCRFEHNVSHSEVMCSYHGTAVLVSAIRLFLLRCHLHRPGHRSMGFMLHPCTPRMCGTLRGRGKPAASLEAAPCHDFGRLQQQSMALWA